MESLEAILKTNVYVISVPDELLALKDMDDNTKIVYGIIKEICGGYGGEFRGDQKALAKAARKKLRNILKVYDGIVLIGKRNAQPKIHSHSRSSKE